MRIEIFLANRLKDEVVQAIPFLPIINAKIILNPLSIGYISEQALMQEARGEINNQFLRTQGGVKQPVALTLWKDSPGAAEKEKHCLS